MDHYKEIIEGCKRNDRLFQEKLYREFYPRLIPMCKRFFNDDHEALEVLNNGMLKVFKHIREYDHLKSSLLTWIYTIVRNAALDKAKLKKHPLPLNLDEALNETFDQKNWSELEQKEVYKLLDHLAPSTRVICSLFYFEGFTISEISSKLGLKPGTVKWHLHETRQKLKPAYEKHFS